MSEANTTRVIVFGAVATVAVSLAIYAYWRSQQNGQDGYDGSTPKSFKCNECQKTKPRASFSKSQFKKKSKAQKENKTFRCLDCTFREAGSSTPSPNKAITAAGSKMVEDKEAETVRTPETTPETECNKELFLAVFTEILRELEYALLHIAQAAQMAIANQGMKLEEAQINELMLVDIQRATADISARVHSKHGITEEMLQIYAQNNPDDPEVSNQIGKLEFMIQNPGRPCPVPADLNKKRIIKICQATHKLTLQAIENQIELARAAGKDLLDEAVAEEVLKRAQEEVEAGKDTIHAEFGLAHNRYHRPEVILQSAMVKFHRDKDFTKTMQMMNAKNSQDTELLWKKVEKQSANTTDKPSVRAPLSDLA